SNYDDSRAFSALHNGLKLVYEKFVSELDRLGIREMSVVGALFDEALHEAILQQPAPEGVAPGTVLGEVQKGYTIGGRVLRHARVVVAS
ncbi:MAG TPA: nucleotide exchange factor GrpE, partial [Rhodothermia bacterium]